MKELYENAEMELVRFSAEDVIATSNNQGNAAGGWDPPEADATVTVTAPTPDWESGASGWS